MNRNAFTCGYFRVVLFFLISDRTLLCVSHAIIVSYTTRGIPCHCHRQMMHHYRPFLLGLIHINLLVTYLWYRLFHIHIERPSQLSQPARAAIPSSQVLFACLTARCYAIEHETRSHRRHMYIIQGPAACILHPSWISVLYTAI